MIEKRMLRTIVFGTTPVPSASYQQVFPCHLNKGSTMPTQELVDHYRRGGSPGSACRMMLRKMELSYGGGDCKKELGLGIY